MLERAAGCFETAGRRLLRDSPGTIQSRRSLSRHFWRHNTAEGDVARWFLALAQPTTSPPFTVLHPAHGKNSAIQVNQPFLDFLYPQNYRDWFLSKDTRHLRRPGSRRRKKGPVGFRRTFTSVVTSVDQSCPKASSGKEPLLNGANPIISTQDGVAQLRGLLTSDADWDYDRAWVSYISLGRPPDIRSELCAYLSQSAKPADQERAWELFEEIPLESRSPADFHHICKSQTYYADPPHLTTILQQALSTGVAVDFCFEASFTHYLKRHDWTRMQEVWAMRFEASELPVKGILPQLSYPELPLDVYAFAKFVRGSATEQRSHLQGISSFLLARITTTASLLESAHLDILLDTFSLFQEVGVARETHFSQAIKCLQQSTSRLKFARSIAFYRQMRSLQPAAKLPKRLMNAQILCLEKFDMTGNIPLFLDEFALFFGKPSNEAYKTAMKAFARTGHVDEVNRLFERFVADHGKPKSRKFVTSLLLVHACNGDVRETWHQFERVKAEFGLEPNVACWNLVLTAYAKTRDVIGAFSAFARMSETRVQPDSGTYNILMGLLAIRGDIDGVRKLLMLAQEQHVQITMPMLGQIISAYLKNGRLDLAERLALVCLDLKVPGSATRIFNALLMQYVFRIDHEGYRRVLAIMDKAGVPSDARTHTAGLLRLTLARKPQKAHLLLRKLHKTGELHATEVHYVIVMLGYIRNREYEQARVIIREIMGRFPDSALQTSLENVLEVIPNKLERVEERSHPSNSLKISSSSRSSEKISRLFTAN
ncbi:hypothetical protein N7468_001050 [Penicillium chermesinum]|uniref:Pentatricopeptide repeat protein n=1 Tax=Penicillium chermesinum TaxID=63820 RepID=A0A9W9TWN1_9EURO|nr:uncharacterized protein N7468_001050 [Penicillium chermesinum]KAJ5246067.1 hypothetical protein N7468_001050 [Penicillium chermesinum]